MRLPSPVIASPGESTSLRGRRRRPKQSPRILFLSLALLFCFPNPLLADSSSANYALVEDRFTGGGGNASSTNYQIAETSFDLFGGGSLTSTNYAAETKIGISGGAGIATINSVSPSDYAKLYTDTGASYTVGATSQDGDSLQYAAKQDSTTKVAAQTSNVLSWTLSDSDVGRHTMGFEVVDPQGTTLKKQEAYVVRRPTK